LVVGFVVSIKNCATFGNAFLMEEFNCIVCCYFIYGIEIFKIILIYLLCFFISLTLSISGFISFATVPCRLSRSLCIIALDSPNSPIFSITAC